MSAMFVLREPGSGVWLGLSNCCASPEPNLPIVRHLPKASGGQVCLPPKLVSFYQTAYRNDCRSKRPARQYAF